MSIKSIVQFFRSKVHKKDVVFLFTRRTRRIASFTHFCSHMKNLIFSSKVTNASLPDGNDLHCFPWSPAYDDLCLAKNDMASSSVRTNMPNIRLENKTTAHSVHCISFHGSNRKSDHPARKASTQPIEKEQL